MTVACSVFHLGNRGAHALTSGGPAFHWYYLPSLFLFWVVLPALVAPIFAREIACGGIDAMRSTQLTPRDAIRGKLFAALYMGLGLLVPTLLGYLLDFPLTYFSNLLVVLAATTIAFTMVCSVCLCLGHVAGSSGAAIAASYVVVAVCLTAPTLLATAWMAPTSYGFWRLPTIKAEGLSFVAFTIVALGVLRWRLEREWRS